MRPSRTDHHAPYAKIFTQKLLGRVACNRAAGLPIQDEIFDLDHCKSPGSLIPNLDQFQTIEAWFNVAMEAIADFGSGRWVAKFAKPFTRALQASSRVARMLEARACAPD